MDERTYEFDEGVRLFLEHLERQCYSTETSSGYGKDLECFRRFMIRSGKGSNFPLDVIGKEELLKFMDDGRTRGNKTSTIGRRLSTMKSFYKFLVYELDYPVDVAASIRIPKVYTPLKAILTEDEVMRLLCSGQQLDSRLSPVRTLERSRVRLADRVIYFPKVKGARICICPFIIS